MPPEPFVRITLNHHARVRLTVRGEEIFRKYWGEAGVPLPDGWSGDTPVELPFWLLMQVFGPGVEFGLNGRPFLDGEIEVLPRDHKANSLEVTLEELTARLEKKPKPAALAPTEAAPDAH